MGLAEATVVVNNDSKIESVTVSSGGSGYTFGTLDIEAGGLPLEPHHLFLT